jgi:hypothetical protein
MSFQQYATLIERRKSLQNTDGDEGVNALVKSFAHYLVLKRAECSFNVVVG